MCTSRESGGRSIHPHNRIGIPLPTPRGPATPRVVVRQDSSNDDDGTEAQAKGKTSSPCSSSADDASSGFSGTRYHVG